jgi:hypothetical protein
MLDLVDARQLVGHGGSLWAREACVKQTPRHVPGRLGN